jgi:hypothetical protein
VCIILPSREVDLFCRGRATPYLSAARNSFVVVLSASTADSYRATGDSAPPCLPSRLSRVRILSIGYVKSLWREKQIGGAYAPSRLLPTWFPPFSRHPIRVRRDQLLLESVLPVRPTVHEDESACVWEAGVCLSLGSLRATLLLLSGGEVESLRNPTAFLLAVFSRPLSRCDPCSFRPPVLPSCCTDGPASLSSPGRCRQCTSKRQGKVCQRQA